MTLSQDNPWDTWLPGHSLPLSHHFVVWLAAELVYPRVVTPSRNYAILGDDIVILDSLVAAKYRELLDDLGVQISPMKSLVSRIGALEFAKRFWVRGGNIYISPISLRLALLTRSPFGLVAFGLKQ